MDIKALRLTKPIKIDSRKLALPNSIVKLDLKKVDALPKHKKGEKFLMGPIPWNWIQKASSYSGKALHVGIAIWHLAFLTKSKTIKLSGKLLKGMGVSRHASYRGLRLLEDADLITTERHQGRNPVVTILET
jgi:hypothetical protein